MKAQAFLELVGKARAEAKQYYATRKNYPHEASIHLIEAKRLEKLVDQVVSEGRLEADEPTAEEAQQLRLQMQDERDAADLLAG